MFVAPDAVPGTLERGFEIGRNLPAAFQRAAFVHFLVSEVHPFSDGNGRQPGVPARMDGRLGVRSSVRVVRSVKEHVPEPPMPSDDAGAIEVFQDLDLMCPDGARLREALCASARSPWHHSTTAAREIVSNALEDVEIIVFERTEGYGVAASRLVLWPEADRYRVANIVPLRCRELGERGYNDVLNDFVGRVARPASEREGFVLRQTDRMQSMTDWTSREAADALRLFSVEANKSTGSAHPSDAQRWRRFLMADHRAKGSLTSSDLERWLIEVEGWPAEVAADLVVERDRADELLSDYDQLDRAES